MKTTTLLSCTAALALALLWPAAASAQQHAHTHGKLALDVAVDASTITITMEAPLDNFLGFERAPRTDAERRQAADAIASLRAADKLFVVDAAAQCTLQQVTLASEVLGLGPKHADAAAGKKDHGEHAEIEGSFQFSCADAAKARAIDVKLFERFQRIRSIDVQLASAQGQFKRTLRRNAPRLTWGQ